MVSCHHDDTSSPWFCIIYTYNLHDLFAWFEINITIKHLQDYSNVVGSWLSKGKSMAALWNWCCDYEYVVCSCRHNLDPALTRHEAAISQVHSFIAYLKLDMTRWHQKSNSNNITYWLCNNKIAYEFNYELETAKERLRCYRHQQHHHDHVSLP